MSYMFTDYSSLTNLPDISKWDIKNVINKRNMFSGCNKNIIPKKFSKYI